MAQMTVPAVVKPLTDNDAAQPVPKTYGDLRESYDIVPEIM
jgi:hypothetical protein